MERLKKISNDALIKHSQSGAETLEPVRFQWLTWYLISRTVLIAGSCFTYTGYTLFKDATVLLLAISTGFVVLFVFSNYIASSQKKMLYNTFEEWRREAMVLLDESASYCYNSGLSQDNFNKSALRDYGYNRYSSTSLFRIGDLLTSYLNVQHVSTEHYYDEKGFRKERTIVKTIYSGTLIIMPAPRRYNGDVVIRHLKRGKLAGYSLLTVASPMLENKYSISVSNEFEGHHLLTPRLIESLIDQSSEYNWCSEYAYCNNNLYLTIANHRLDFGISPGKWYVIDVDMLYNIIETCNLTMNKVKTTAAKLTSL